VLKFIETLRLIRVVNCLLTMVGVGVGARLTWFTPEYYAPIMAAWAAFFVCAAGNVVNDLMDIEIDRINNPGRVLVKGTLTPRYARALAIVLNVVGLALAFMVSLEVGAVALLVSLLLLFYNLRAKKIPVIGNLIIALLAGMTFITGGMAVNLDLAFVIPGPLVAAIFAFLFHLVREIIKDIQDIDGDRQAGATTLPQLIGVQRSLLLSLIIFFLLVLFTLLPIFMGWFGPVYKIITVYIIDLPLLAFLIFLWGNPSSGMLRFGSMWLKVGMALGVVALALA